VATKTHLEVSVFSLFGFSLGVGKAMWNVVKRQFYITLLCAPDPSGERSDSIMQRYVKIALEGAFAPFPFGNSFLPRSANHLTQKSVAGNIGAKDPCGWVRKGKKDRGKRVCELAGLFAPEGSGQALGRSVPLDQCFLGSCPDHRTLIILMVSSSTR
jgi:hypothetical protein